MQPHMPDSDTHRTTWDFLADTYWYVTPPDLPALQLSPDDGVLTWRGDQTVWHISGYENGYFGSSSKPGPRDFATTGLPAGCHV
jgi:hypothetical protein